MVGYSVESSSGPDRNPAELACRDWSWLLACPQTVLGKRICRSVSKSAARSPACRDRLLIARFTRPPRLDRLLAPGLVRRATGLYLESGGPCFGRDVVSSD